MRKTFIVLGKLLGLLMLYRVLSIFTQIGGAVGMWKMSAERSGPDMLAWVAILVVNFLLSFTLTVLLIFKTDGIADLFGLKDEHLIAAPSIRDMLITGCLLIGVYTLVFAIPSFVKNMVEIAFWNGWEMARLLSGLAASFLQLCLGLLLVLKAKAVATLLKPKEEKEGHPEVPNSA